MKEYIVVAHSESNIDSLHQDLTRETREDLGVNPDTIPYRSVDVANERLGNPRITHYYLTDREAENLANDPRVENVHAKPNESALGKTAIQKSISYDGRIGNFNRDNVQDRYNINWGLRRTSLTTAESAPGNTYEYNNTGAGVDIVIVDDGVEADHPEFFDSTGKSRVFKIDWYKETGIPGRMPPNHYKSNSYSDMEHGTHVASIAAGNTFGYAKNSRIYSIRIFGGESETIDINDVFDLIRVWHEKKTVDPRTGYRRPTICNLSWAYSWVYPSYQIDKIVYRNTVNNFPTGTRTVPAMGQVGLRHGMVVPSLDAELLDAEKAGVIFVQSAGNFAQKIDVPGGPDYNNYYTSTETWGGIVPPGQPIYYHRGSSPSSPNVIKVSAARDATKFVNGKLLEQLDAYSDRGPGCAVIAPGTNITAATSRSSSFRKSEYVWGRSRTDRKFAVSKESGTSMAAPQVTGVLALYLSENPTASPEQAKTWIMQTSVKDQMFTNYSNTDYTNPVSLLGGPNQYLYNPFRNNYQSRS